MESVDVVVVGAGISGLYQLYRSLEEGFSARLIEAGSSVGGTWYWNRYPEARFDSESYTYGFIFSAELFREWSWSEHFAGQPEVERYMNHMVDKFDLRKLMTFNAKVDSAVYDESRGRWTVTADDGTAIDAQYFVPCTGVLSVPFFPEVEGRHDFRGESYHTGLWPKDEVSFEGKRVALIGTGSSGVQIVPAVKDRVESLTVFQRTANWATPLNNRPITDEEQADLKANFESMRVRLMESPGGFLHVPSGRMSTEDPDKATRWAFYEKAWNSPGFSTISHNYTDVLMNPAVNDEWCEFVAEKIRTAVKDPDTAEKLIPKDHRYMEKRPPFGTNYYEAYNNDNVELVSLKEHPIVRITETGIETTDGFREFDMIIWATGFDFGTGAMNRMGIVGRDGLKLTDYWSEGPVTFCGVQAHNFPNMFFPGGPHGSAGNNPRYNGHQTDWVISVQKYVREHGFHTVEVTKEFEDGWCRMVEEFSAKGVISEKSYFYGTNIPGKPKRFLLNPGGRAKMEEFWNDSMANDHQGQRMT
jgi:cation diffusion facilitator CzcD-associated flavoprotein CzcO